MPTKRTLEQINQREFLKMSELAELTGVRYSTIKYYCELGLLLYEQKGKRLAKYYPAKEASERIKEILKMKEKRQTINDIINFYAQKI
jgi:DNA-binding transcriptional MerR regulator